MHLRRIGRYHLSAAYFIVAVCATSEHFGAEQPSQLILPFDAVLWVPTIALIILVKSKPPSAQSEHKQLNLNTA